MRYEDARALIKDGDVVAVKRRSGILAFLTRLVTKSPYTHTGICFWWGGRLLMAQANGGGVNFVPVSQEAEFDFDVYDCPPGLDAAAVVAQAWQILDTRSTYDIADLFRIWLFLWFGLPLPKVDNASYICSSLSARILLACGWVPVGLPSIPWPGAVVAALNSLPRLEIKA